MTKRHCFVTDVGDAIEKLADALDPERNPPFSGDILDLLEWATKDVLELRQQLAEVKEEKARGAAAALLTVQQDYQEIKSLKFQLVEHEKQVALLRDVMQEVLDDVWLKTSHELARKFSEALTATDDLSGYILCKREPVAHMYQHDETGRTTFVVMPDRMSERRWYEVPLYRAKEK